ncbi:MAG: helix-turn-helix domain-containing protein [Phycisphaerales bacterium]|nr:helix-turn-helix domain-containing protein [Phycisphaerales bacterium]
MRNSTKSSFPVSEVAGGLNPLAKPDPQTPCLAMRPREAAAALGVSERTLWTWTNEGAIPHIRRGKTIMYPVNTLTHWLDEQATAKTTEGGAE